MRWLALARYSPISVDFLLDHWNDRKSLPAKPVAITFDDGFQDCFDYAVPIMQARGFTATFYFVAGLIGKTSRWLISERRFELPLMDWQTVKRLETAGFHVGAHSLSHPRLDALSPAACRAELIESRRLLEDKLGHEIRDMAYPFGAFNESVRATVADTGYRSACSVQIGISNANDDPLALKRVPVNGEESLLDFAFRLQSGHSARECLRGAAKHVFRRQRQAVISGKQ